MRSKQKKRRRALGKKLRRSEPRRGIVLVIVLLVITLLSLAGYSYSEYMFSEYRGTVVSARLVQARLAAESGVEHMKVFLMQDRATIEANGGTYENPIFQMGLVSDTTSDRDRSRFAVIAPIEGDDGSRSIRFGLEDESTRLNVNSLPVLEDMARQIGAVNEAITGVAASENPGRDLLMALPGMTEETADAILDFIDSDDEAREFGCESDFYTGMSPPYACRNGPLMSVEELLLVRGVTPALLFGPDVNRNGVVDPSEEGRDSGDGPQSGWAAYLTLFGQERNIRADGQPRINLNNSDLEALYEEMKAAGMPDEWSNFIIAYRQNGPYRGTNPSSGAIAPAPDFSAEGSTSGGTQLSQVLDLVGAKVQVIDDADDDTRIVVDSPFPDALHALYLPDLMDLCTANASPVIPGRININQAPATILAGIPGMSEEILDGILSARTPEASDSDAGRRSETWILAEGIVTLDEMKAMMPYVNAGGSVYRAQVIGYFDQDGPAARLEAVVDATTATPRIVFWRDISHLGPGYPTELLGVEDWE
jgi:hypothetical protein